jgi:hypothetical protein
MVFIALAVPLLPAAIVIVEDWLYVPPRMKMVPPAVTRVMAEASVVGLACVPGALAEPFGAT